MYHKDYEELVSEGVMPRIPVQPVSYGDIVDFMSQLSEFTPPPELGRGAKPDVQDITVCGEH